MLNFIPPKHTLQYLIYLLLLVSKTQYPSKTVTENSKAINRLHALFES